MREQHLSDEAIAAFADDVLNGSARERARRHTASCAECNYAVTEQRAAIWALRSAAAPPLPSGLLERLREVPVTTPIRSVPTTVDDKGRAMFATFAAPAAAFVPTQSKPRGKRVRPIVLTAASVAVVGALAASAAAADGAGSDDPNTGQPARVSVPFHRAVPQPQDAQFLQAQLPVHAR
jgi:anti-sigma factor RsiW